MKEALTDYIVAKQRQCDQRVITACQVGTIRKELALMEGFFPKATIRELSPHQLTEFCERGKQALKTVNSRAIVPPNLQHTRAFVAAKFTLSKDVMRHTFIPMFVGHYCSIGEAALQAGNSGSVIRCHYLDLKGKVEAKQFWDIRPAKAGIRAISEGNTLPCAPSGCVANAIDASRG